MKQQNKSYFLDYLNLLIITTQFVEINIAGTAITIQKMSVLLFSVSVLLLFTKKLTYFIPGYSILLSICLCMGLIFVHRDINLVILELSKTALSVIFLYSLYIYFNSSGFRLDRFYNTWINAGIISSIIISLQVSGFPLFYHLTDEQIYGLTNHSLITRGVALKSDPNFIALMLCLGFVFASINKKKKYIKLILFIGIALTFSRMGIILVTLVMLRDSLTVKGIFRLVGIAVILVLSIYTVSRLQPDNLAITYAQERYDETLASIQSTDRNLNKTTSSEARLMLALGSVELGSDYFWSGVGAHKVDDALGKAVGVEKASHNSYLEYYATGGIFGLFLLLLMYLGALRYLDANILLVLSISGLFLTLIYNSILLILLALGLSFKLLKN